MNSLNNFLCLGFALVLTLSGCGTSTPVQRGWQPDSAAGHDATSDTSAAIPARLSPDQAEDVTLYALGLVGTPYRFGGNTPDGGFDCSGLIDHVYQARVGLKAPRTVAKLQYWGAPVPDDALRSGDLVLFAQRGAATHAGIYVGDGRFVHAPSTGGTVRLDDLNSRYWASQRTSFRRP
jgi:cell wall-associated NlpC family hydrolase